MYLCHYITIVFLSIIIIYNIWIVAYIFFANHAFFIILAFVKNFNSNRNKNIQILKFLETDRFLISRDRISSRTEEPNQEQPNAHPKRVLYESL